MALSKDFYVMHGGGCRRVLVDEQGNMDEYPNDFESARKCELPGDHADHRHQIVRK